MICTETITPSGDSTARSNLTLSPSGLRNSKPLNTGFKRPTRLLPSLLKSFYLGVDELLIEGQLWL
jgi:hypothetical protein